MNTLKIKNMDKWKKDDGEFTVSVMDNIKCRTNYISKPFLNLLESPQRITFVIENDKVMVKVGKK